MISYKKYAGNACFRRLHRAQKKDGYPSPDMHPVKRTEKKYKIFPASSQMLLAAFYAARHNLCFSIGVSTPKLRCTRLVL